jgi:hypothetical protein
VTIGVLSFDLWQRAGLVVVSVASREDVLRKLFDAVRREAETQVPGHVVETGAEFIHGADGGDAGWSAEAGQGPGWE